MRCVARQRKLLIELTKTSPSLFSRPFFKTKPRVYLPGYGFARSQLSPLAHVRKGCFCPRTAPFFRSHRQSSSPFFPPEFFSPAYARSHVSFLRASVSLMESSPLTHDLFSSLDFTVSSLLISRQKEFFSVDPFGWFFFSLFLFPLPRSIRLQPSMRPPPRFLAALPPAMNSTPPIQP